MITKDKRKNTQVTKITNEGGVIIVDQELTPRFHEWLDLLGDGKKEPIQQSGWSYY